MKNRSNVFNVVRYEKIVIWEDDNDLQEYYYDAHTVGTYRTLERAEEVAASYNQQVSDGDLPSDFQFGVQASVFYDE